MALIAVAFLCVPAFAAVQNVKVSGNIESTWLVRDQFDFGDVTAATGDFYQNLLITQAILRVDADLTDNVQTVLSLINERDWGSEAETSDLTTDVAVNLAYVALKEFLYSPLTLIIGRQHLNYGNAFIVGKGGPNNSADGRLGSVANDLTKRTAMDAVKAILNYDPLTIDIFAAKVDENIVAGANNKDHDDTDLYGFNANYKLGDSRNTEIESYFFAKIDKSTVATGTAGEKTDTVYTPGLRVATNPIEGLWTSAEVAWQGGNKTNATGSSGADNLRREAMGAQVISSYQVPFMKEYNPVLSNSYTYTSGDSNPTDVRAGDNMASDDKWTGWDQMYEDQAAGTIYNTLADLTNTHIYNAALQVTPIEDVTAKLSWWGLWWDKEADRAASTTSTTIKQPDGTTVSLTNELDKRHIGNEFDAELLYNYTEDVQIGFIASWFFAGNYWHSDNDDVAKQFLTKVSANF